MPYNTQCDDLESRKRERERDRVMVQHFTKQKAVNRLMTVQIQLIMKLMKN